MRRLLCSLLIAVASCAAGNTTGKCGEGDITPVAMIPVKIKAKCCSAAFQPGTNHLFLAHSTTKLATYTIHRRPLEPSRELTSQQRQQARRLVEDLNHPQYTVRVTATRKLHAMQHAVAPLLIAAQEQIEPLERRMAATRLLQRFEHERQQRMLARVRTASTLGTFGYMQDMAFSPGGNRLMLAGANLIMVRDVKSGEIIRRFYTDQRFHDVKMLAGGKLIAAAERDQVRVWSIATGRQVRRFKQFMAVVYCCAATPDGNKLIIGGGAKYLHVVSLRTGRLLSRIDGLPSYANDVAVSPDGKMVAAAGVNGAISLFDLQTGELVTSLNDDVSDTVQNAKRRSHAFRIEFSPDGRYLASSGIHGSILLWNLRTREAKLLGDVALYEQPAICFSSDGRFLFTGSRTHAKVWQIAPPDLDDYLSP